MLARLPPDETASGANASAGRGKFRQLAIAWLHLSVLWAFAFAKPLFDVVADSPEFFVARGNTRGDIILFAVAAVLLVPTVLVLCEACLWRLPTARRALHLLFVAGLAGAFALQVLADAVGPSAALLLLLAALVGAAVAFAYSRVRAVPMVLTVLGPAPLVFLMLFLLLSPVSKLVLPQGEGAAAAAEVKSNTPVVLLVLDELDPNMLMNSNERIDRTRYPNLAALAARSTWYPNATTVNTQTTTAVPALLSGRVPDPGALPIAADHPNNLFTLLENSHSLDVTETATEICPAEACGERARKPFPRRIRSLAKDLGVVSLHLVLPQGLRSKLPAVDQNFENFAGGARDDEGSPPPPAGEVAVPAAALQNRTSIFEEVVSRVERDEKRPSLRFLHAALPHMPWQYLPTGQQYVVSGPDSPGLVDEVWTEDPVPARLGLQRHLLQVGFVDQLVGRLVGRLRRTDVFDRALVIITADHGVSFRAGLPRRRATSATLSDVGGVPLLIKYPQQRRGRVDGSMVRTVGVVPTIADELGTELPWKADGLPIRGGTPGGDRVEVWSGSGGQSVGASFDAFVRQRKAGLRRMLRLTGSDVGWSTLFASGQSSALLGRRAAELSTAAPAPARVEFDSAELFRPVSAESRLVPSFVTGRIVGELGAGQRLAVAVNGKIRGLTASFRDGEDVRLGAMVPSETFHAGANEVEVFAVKAEGSTMSLLRLGGERPASYRLVEKDGETLVVGAGRETPAHKGSVEGFVDSLDRDDEGVIIGGWAADRAPKRPADRILVFEDGRLLAQEEPSVARPDITESFDSPAVAQSGFELRTNALRGELSAIRVFALSAGEASELPLFED